MSKAVDETSTVQHLQDALVILRDNIDDMHPNDLRYALRLLDDAVMITLRAIAVVTEG